MSSWFGLGKKKEGKSNLKKVEDFALNIWSGEKLEKRLDTIDYLHLAIEGGNVDLSKYIKEDSNDVNSQVILEINKLSRSKSHEDQITSIYLQLKVMDRVLRKKAIPWLRGGSEKTSAKCLRGWEGLYSLAKAIVRDIENIFSRDEDDTLASKLMDRSEILFNLKTYLTVCPFKYGLYICDISYRNEDVQPEQLALLLNMAQGQSHSGIIPGTQFQLTSLPPNPDGFKTRLKE